MPEKPFRELADTIAAAHPDLPYSEALDRAQPLVDAGYRRRRTITTAEEAAALPPGVVLMVARDHGIGVVLEQTLPGQWFTPALNYQYQVTDIWFPAVVLWDPAEEDEP